MVGYGRVRLIWVTVGLRNTGSQVQNGRGKERCERNSGSVGEGTVTSRGVGNTVGLVFTGVPGALAMECGV